ncbi:MAG: hypothetical protein RIS47_946 [Bacteroidota bacterium]
MKNLKKLQVQMLFVAFLIAFAACDKESDFNDVHYQKVDAIATDGYILDMAIDVNNIKWFATTDGLVKLDGNTTTVYKRAQGMGCDTVTRVATDANGDVWCITDKASILQFNGSKFVIHKPSTPAVKVLSQPTAITVDNNNQVVVSTINGLYTYNGSDWSVYYFGVPLEVGNINNLCKHPLDPNYILITNDDNTRFTFDGNSVKPLESIMGYPCDSVRCFTSDASLNVYCGITVRGLLVSGTATPKIRSLGTDLGDNAISHIAVATNNCIWVTTANGIVKIENDNITRYLPRQLPINDIEHIKLDKNNKLWFCNKGGVYTME